VLPYLKRIPEQKIPGRIQPNPQGCSIETLISPVELSFRAFRLTLPIDHGYGLYAALSHLEPKIHLLNREIGIQAITGGD
jgi:hypothetical protein